MGWTGNGFVAAVERPIALRCRADLQVYHREHGGSPYYVIKSPWAHSYCQLESEEYWLLCQIDGKRSLSQIKDSFERHFPGKRLDLRRMESLVRYLFQLGLLTSCASGQGHQLLRRKQLLEHAAGPISVQRLLSLRFRGINPDRFLSRLAQQVTGLYRWPIFFLLISFMVATIGFAIGNWSVFVTRLPQVQSLVELHSVFGLMTALALMKVLHELAHGVTCKVFGGECTELGLMLLLFVPCLYCDVSDSWKIESRRKRIAITAAGVFAESIVATVAFWVWWFANPGIIHTIAIQICIVGSISTLMINGNPLMRYDGYFVLSDLWNFPNLWSESRRAFWNRVRQFYSKALVNPAGPVRQNRSTFLTLLYAVASICYQIVTVALIMSVIFIFCSEQRIELVGIVLLTTILATMIFQTSTRARASLNRVGGIRKLRRGRALGSLVLLIALIVFLMWGPVPFSIHAPGLVRSPELTPVVVVAKGRLISSIEDGSYVEVGEPIAQLRDSELLLDLETRRGELFRQRARLDGLESRRSIDKSVAVQIPPVREAIEGLELEVKKLEKEVDSLVLRATRKGKVVLTPAASSDPTIESKSPLLATENIGSLLQTGTIAAWIRNVEGIEVVTFLTQHQVQWVQLGQPVTLKLKWQPNISLQGKVIDVGTSELRQIPTELVATGAYTFKNATGAKQETTAPVYAVRIRCESDMLPTYENAIGSASIHVSWQPLSTRLVRWFQETFNVSVRGSRQQPL